MAFAVVCEICFFTIELFYRIFHRSYRPLPWRKSLRVRLVLAHSTVEFRPAEKARRIEQLNWKLSDETDSTSKKCNSFWHLWPIVQGIPYLTLLTSIIIEKFHQTSLYSIHRSFVSNHTYLVKNAIPGVLLRRLRT